MAVKPGLCSVAGLDARRELCRRTCRCGMAASHNLYSPTLQNAALDIAGSTQLQDGPRSSSPAPLYLLYPQLPSLPL
jgi:hypothetical protein